MDLMWFLMLGHLAGDYAFQSDRMADEKRSSHRALTIHVLIYTAAIALVLFIYSQWTGAFLFWTLRTGLILAAMFTLHWTQDYLKGRYFRSRQAYYQDQLLHLLQLFVIRWLMI